jgi:hypothetical protein
MVSKRPELRTILIIYLSTLTPEVDTDAHPTGGQMPQQRRENAGLAVTHCVTMEKF